MRRVLVTAVPSFDDVVLLEPAIEALYYKFAPCYLILQIPKSCFPFFEHHPLIEELVDISAQDKAADHHVALTLDHWPITLPTVEKFAAFSRVSLLRKTPSIFLEEAPEEWNGVVVTSPDILPPEAVLDRLGVTAAQLSANPATALPRLASASLVVGCDNWMTQAAAALNTRVVIGLPPEREKLRRPFNSVVANPDASDLLEKCAEVWYEKKYPDFMNLGNAADFIKNKAKEYMKSGYIDMGCSQWPLPNSIPVDKSNRALVEKAKPESFSGLFSSHCLEHIEDWKSELALWHRVIRRHGVLFLYLPHPACGPWKAHTGEWVGHEHVWNPEPVTLVRHLKEVLDFDILEYTSRQDSLWSFYIIARKR